MRAVILCGGEIYDYAAISLRHDDYIICADAGAKHLSRLGVHPNVLVGDFDTAKETFEGVQRVTFPKEKDETDTYLAARYAISEGFNEICVLGALGGRADHSIANIYMLKYIAESGAKGMLDDGKNKVFLAYEPFEISQKGIYVSLFSIFGDVTGVTLVGMKYPLTDYTISAGDSIGISNEVALETARVSFKSGTMLVMLCRD